MPTLRPLRDLDPHEIIPYFSYDGKDANRGTFVTIKQGFKNDQDFANDALGKSFSNTLSERWNVPSKVGTATSGDTVLGMLLYDVKETDENGEKLIFNPQKAIEKHQVVSGQAVPVVRRGTFLYSGVAGNPTAGAAAYINDKTNDGTVSPTGSTQIGTFLGPKDDNNHVLLFVDV